MAPKPRPWFRFYVEAVYDRKLRRQKPEHRWLFVVCLAMARQSPQPGWLLIGDDDPAGWDDLVDAASMPLRSVEAGMGALRQAGVVSYDEPAQCWFIPQWGKRQFESDLSTPRAAASRAKERSRNGDATANATAPETETDTETDLPPYPPEHPAVDNRRRKPRSRPGEPCALPGGGVHLPGSGVVVPFVANPAVGGA